jgi:5'-nucleotidase (lipoprotein e(P4) family)
LKSQVDVSKTKHTEPELLPILWQQHAAEYIALCYQAFNIAEWQIEKFLSESKTQNPKAIITDLDETIIDNSYCFGSAIKNSIKPNWDEWKSMSMATALPGAVKFLQDVHEKGIDIFYVSNRDTSEAVSTLRNLIKLNMPNADRNHLLLMNNSPSKEFRRRSVAEKYEVILYLGDNLQDFSSGYEHKLLMKEPKLQINFVHNGEKHTLILPNPVYGDWLNTLHNHQFELNANQKDSIYMTLLKGY